MAFLIDENGFNGRVNEQSCYGETPLMNCCAFAKPVSRQIETIKLLLSRGAAVDAVDRNDRDAAAYAAYGQNTEAAALVRAVRAAGGWRAYLIEPRLGLFVLKALAAKPRPATAVPGRLHAGLFTLPDAVFRIVTQYWQSDRDPRRLRP